MNRKRYGLYPFRFMNRASISSCSLKYGMLDPVWNNGCFGMGFAVMLGRRARKLSSRGESMVTTYAPDGIERGSCGQRSPFSTQSWSWLLIAVVLWYLPATVGLTGDPIDEIYLPAKGETDMPTNDTSHAASFQAMRLIFEYEGDEVHLISQQPVDVAITGFDISRSLRPGYYIDTRDSSGRTLARVPARDAFTTSREVFPEQRGQPITRVDTPHGRGAFTVIVPVPAGANRVAVVQVTPGAEATMPGARGTTPVPGSPEVKELGSFDLDINR